MMNRRNLIGNMIEIVLISIACLITLVVVFALCIISVDIIVYLLK